MLLFQIVPVVIHMPANNLHYLQPCQGTRESQDSEESSSSSLFMSSDGSSATGSGDSVSKLVFIILLHVKI